MTERPGWALSVGISIPGVLVDDDTVDEVWAPGRRPRLAWPDAA